MLQNFILFVHLAVCYTFAMLQHWLHDKTATPTAAQWQRPRRHSHRRRRHLPASQTCNSPHVRSPNAKRRPHTANSNAMYVCIHTISVCMVVMPRWTAHARQTLADRRTGTVAVRRWLCAFVRLSGYSRALFFFCAWQWAKKYKLTANRLWRMKVKHTHWQNTHTVTNSPIYSSGMVVIFCRLFDIAYGPFW